MRCPSILRRAQVALGVLLLCPVSALALECETVNIEKGSQRLDLVASVCTGLKDAKDWWLYAGEEPSGDSATPVKMTRKVCKEGKEVVGLYALSKQPKVSKLALICVAPEFRREGKGLELLNLAAADVKTGVMQWVSQSDPATQNFYKGLKVGCQEEENGPATNRNTGERYFKFSATVKEGASIERKPRLWYRLSGGKYIPVRYECSAVSAFEAIYGDEVIQSMLQRRELIAQLEPPSNLGQGSITFEQIAALEDL